MPGKTEHSGFESREYGRGRGRKYTVRYFDRQYGGRPDRLDDNGASMLLKMGICALLCALALLSSGLEGGLAKYTSAAAEKPEDVEDEYLGRLRFVKLPGIMEVFSSGARLRVGVENDGWELSEENTLLSVYGAGGKAMPCPTEGRIKAVSGGTVELAIAGDVVISYGNAGKVNVEEGQPVKTGDTLFTCMEPLDIRIYDGGRPSDPTKYFDMSGMLPA